MCLGIPMRIIERSADTAVVELGGITQVVGLDLLPGAKPGDFVIVHAGFALEQVDLGQAVRTLELIGAATARRAGPEPHGKRQ